MTSYRKSINEKVRQKGIAFVNLCILFISLSLHALHFLLQYIPIAFLALHFLLQYIPVTFLVLHFLLQYIPLNTCNIPSPKIHLIAAYRVLNIKGRIQLIPLPMCITCHGEEKPELGSAAEFVCKRLQPEPF